MKKEKLGIAILGAGAIANVHIQAYLQLCDLCEIRVICDLFPQKAKDLIDEYQLTSAVAVKNYQEALSRKDIDAVSICLPPGAHADIAVLALNSGKHVICEKPMAGSLEECDAMLCAAKYNGKLLSVIAQNRFKTPNQKVKCLLDEGAIGSVLSATVNSLWWRGENYYDIWWRGTWEKESGGCVINHAVHHIDLILWMLGKPDSVRAFITNLGHGNSECEDYATVIMSYPGKVVQLNASLVTHDEKQELIFQGKRAEICVPWRVASSRAQPNGFPESNEEIVKAIQKRYKELPDLTMEGHSAQIRNFVRAIRGEEILAIDGEQGRSTIELIAAIYKSAYVGQRIDLPIVKDDIFYRKGGIPSVMPHFHEKQKSIENFTKSKPITLGRDVGK
ncbi:MAG: Gfo/Idh/MocA family oxidoreductase [Clostridiales bacterium]|nr:Gfo/Idh/MocA family oxidoreductase [Clostridiales bacterium]